MNRTANAEDQDQNDGLERTTGWDRKTKTHSRTIQLPGVDLKMVTWQKRTFQLIQISVWLKAQGTDEMCFTLPSYIAPLEINISDHQLLMKVLYTPPYNILIITTVRRVGVSIFNHLRILRIVNYSLCQRWRTYGTRVQSGTRDDFAWHTPYSWDKTNLC